MTLVTLDVTTPASGGTFLADARPAAELILGLRLGGMEF